MAGVSTIGRIEGGSRLRRLVWAAAVCVFVWSGLVGLAFAGPARTVTDLRLGVHADKTRFVIDLDGGANYTIFSLANPYRVVIDLPELAWRVPNNQRRRSGGGISGYRFGLFEPGISRIVIDLSKPLRVTKAFLLPPDSKYGHRLVVDLKRVPRVEFLRVSRRSIERRLATRKRTGPAQKAVPVVRTPAPKPKAKKARHVIVLDPGHGGVDPGTIGKSGRYEKHLVMKIAQEAKRVLEATGRYKVVLTRERDIFLRLRQRLNIARDVEADLFISLHADSIENKRLRGASVYTLSEKASDKEAAALARHANKADIIAGMDFSDEPPEVANILIDLAQRETMNMSARYAQSLVAELSGQVRLLNRPHRFAGFAVLKAPDVPSVLFELGFMSNESDETLLHSAQHRRVVVEGIRRSVDRYFRDIRSASR